MFYLLTLLVLVGIVSFATYFVLSEPGYIMLQWGIWQVELSLVLAVALLVLLVLVLFVGLEVLAGVVRMPGRVGRSFRAYRGQKRYAASVKGIKHLLLGNWTKAEKLLDGSAAHLPEPVVSYLAAAYAAQRQGSIPRRNKYLKKARLLDKSDQALVSLFTCKLELERGEYAVAIEELRKLCAQMPRNPLAFGLLATAYEKTEDWDALEMLLPHIQKSQARTSEEIVALSTKVVRHRLRAAERSLDLQKTWKSATKSAQSDPDIIATYVRKLFEFNCHKEVDKVIRNALERSWNSELAYLYSMIHGEMNDRRLYDTVVKWIETHPDDADLLLSAGKLARRVGMNGKARAHLQKSIELGGRKDAYEELGKLLEEQEQHDAAFSVYKSGVGAPRG